MKHTMATIDEKGGKNTIPSAQSEHEESSEGETDLETSDDELNQPLT